MKRFYSSIFFVLFLGLFNGLVGQNNLSVRYADSESIPDFLNLCGQEDTVALVIRVDGFDNEVRSNIEAELNLFKGIRLVKLLSGTDPMVGLQSGQNTSQVSFSLPNLSRNGQDEVRLEFSIQADCQYLDTLEQNDQLRVFDVWNLNYEINSIAFSESHATLDYRDALEIPFFSMEVIPQEEPASFGACFTRTIIVRNTSSEAYVDTLRYQNIQGIGVLIDDIQVNGISIPFNAEAINGSEIEISAAIDSAVFVLNKNLDGSPGNGDGRFGTDEVITITEFLCVQSCDLPLGSNHVVSWGCYGETCQEFLSLDFIRLGEGEASVNTTVGNAMDQIDAGYCQSGTTSLLFTNNGFERDSGFGTMFDLTLGLGMGGSFLLQENGYEIVEFQIGGLTLSSFLGLNDLDGNAQFLQDPDGVGGLTDSDGDGYYDDLPVGESVEILVNFSYDCSLGNVLNLDDNCLNSYSTVFNGRIGYTDICGDRNQQSYSNYYRPTNNSSFVSSDTEPDAFLGNQTFFIRHKINKFYDKFAYACNGNEEIIVSVVLPSGLDVSVAESKLIKNGISDIDLLQSSKSGDTLRLHFDGSTTSHLRGDYELELALQADCNADLGPTNFDLTIEYYCPSCACNHIWYCGTVEGPWLHATNPPCPPEVLIVCDPGIQTTDFNVNRTTFGFADKNYTIPFDPVQANRKVAIPCDSVEMVISNFVGDQVIADSFGLSIGYSNIASTASDQIFLFDKANIRFVKSSQTLSCTIDASVLSALSNGDEKQLNFDLSQCLTDLGIVLEPGDSVIFEGQFAINPDGPILFQFKNVPNFRAFAYTIVNGESIWCDQFGERFMVGKSNTVFDFPDNNDFPEGCDEAEMEYRLIKINNGFQDFFGEEYRASAKVHSIEFDFETSVFDAFEDGSVEVLYRGHPVHGNDFYPLAPLSDFPDGHYVANFDTLSYSPPLNERQSEIFNIRVKLQPNCSSISASQNADNRYQFNAAINYDDRYYAKDIGDASCVDARLESVDQFLKYTHPPELDFTPVGNTNFILTEDTAIWTVRLCNSSFYSDLNHTWFAFESPNSAVELFSIRDVTYPGNPQTLQIRNYGTSGLNYFAFADGLDKVSGQSSLEDVCKTIEFKGVVRICGTSILNAKAGWNCGSYENSEWQPLLNDACETFEIPLSISTTNPFLEASVEAQPAELPEICDTSEVTIILRNVDIGAVYDLNTAIFIPLEGTTLLTNSVEIAYPSGTDFIPALGNPTFSGVTSLGQKYSYSGFNLVHNYLNQEGLAGVNLANPTDSNEMKIKFRFLTDCDFKSGSLAYFNFQGLKGCGDLSNFEAGETFPILIEGAEPDPNKLFEISLDPGSILLSNTLSTISITTTNLTTLPSTAEDNMVITLPFNVFYAPNTATGIFPATWVPGEPTIQIIGGFQKLTWTLPAGMVQNDFARLEFGVNTPFYTCDDGPEQIRLFTTNQKDLFCSTSNEICSVECITSTDGNMLTDIPIGETVFISINDIESICDTGRTESVTISLSLEAFGFTYSGETEHITIYADENSNGLFDNNEAIIANFQEVAPGGGSNWNISLTFNAPVDMICNLGVIVDNTELPICEIVESLIPAPELKNAGESRMVCNSAAIFIDTIGNLLCNENDYSFNWTAIPPAQISYLSGTDVANPIVSIPTNIGFNQYDFIVETQRNDCSGGFDTVSLVLSNGLSVDLGDDFYLATGNSAPLVQLTLGGVPPYNYNWSPTNSLDLSNPLQPIASPLVTTRYFLEITDSLGCSDTSSVLVLVRDPVEAEATPAISSICKGEQVQLLASGGDGYLWIGHPGNPNGGGQLSAMDVADPVFMGGLENETYSYDVIVSDSDFPGYPDTATISIHINESPSADAGATDMICAGDGIQLNGSASGGDGNYLFEWSDGSTGANPFVQPLNSTFYYLTVTDGNSCVDYDTVFVQVVLCDCAPAQIGSIVIINTECDQSSGAALINTIDDISNYTFTWIPDFGTGMANEKTNLPFGGYMVEIRNTNDTSCKIEIPIVIQNEDGPTATYNSTPATCNDFNGTAILQPSNYEFLWFDGAINNSRNDLQSGTYFVTITNPNQPDCQNVLRVDVLQENPLIVETIINEQPTCGHNNGSVTLNVIGGSGNYSYNWPSNSATQNDLPAGVYNILIRDLNSNGCQIPALFVLTDRVPSANIMNLDTLNITCPGSADGGINFDLSFDPGFQFPADTIITNGLQTFQNGQLTQGDYCLEVLDANGCVAGGTCFSIEEPEPLELNIDAKDKCGSALGEIAVSVNGGTPPYQFDWLDINSPNEPKDRTGLQAGIYSIRVLDENNCNVSTSIQIDSCTLCDYFDDGQFVLLQADACSSSANLCIAGDLAVISGLFVTDNGEVLNYNPVPCAYDTTGYYNFLNLFNQGNSGPYVLNSWYVDGVMFSGEFDNLSDLLDSMNTWDPWGNWTLSPGVLNIYGGQKAVSYGEMHIWDVAFGIQSKHNFLSQTITTGYGIPLDTGFHHIILTDTINYCVDNFFVNVVCTQNDTIRIEIILTQSDTLCFSSNELLAPFDTLYNNCYDGSFVSYESYQDSCLILTGEEIGNELACIVVCDSLGICDTTFVIIDVVLPPGSDKEIRDTISILQSVTQCCDTSDLRLLGDIHSIENVCPQLSGTEVEFYIDTSNFCVTYTGLEIGMDTACIVFCDSFGICDTVNFYITVAPGEIIYDTIYLSVDTVVYCFSDTLLPGNIVDIVNDCPVSSGEVVFEIDTISNCITYYGVNLGLDTACLVLIDDLGNQYRPTIVVEVITTHPSTYCDTIFINETVKFCPDLSELPGQEVRFIDNFCLEESGEYVDFFISPGDTCMEYTGLEIGKDSACIIVCDERGVCDTTYLCVYVIEYGLAPLANPDCDTTVRATPVVVNVGANDIRFGRTACPEIVDPPLWGTVRVNPDCSISYLPEDEYCERNDYFIYEICNENGCDTALVKIFIKCIDITIFSAVSPNRDGQNDFFYIAGLDDKPDNSLEIYNRWGNRVYQTENYRNNWEGTWNGKALPDGSYFYIFRVTDNGITETFQGYLELFR